MKTIPAMVFLMLKLRMMLMANANMDVASIDQSHMVNLSEGEKGTK